jgi:anti-sigma regulatory factor (Ser/Thr protein kinase)
MTSPEPIATPGQPPPPADEAVIDRRFAVDDLYTVRAEVAAHAAGLGASPADLERLLIVASELATNAIRHGGGNGRLQLWANDGMVRCRVVDGGPGLTDPEVGMVRPDPDAAGGHRGLWLCRQLSDELTVESSPVGTAITAGFHLAR